MTHPFFEELQDEMKQSQLWQSAERANQLQKILYACEAANFRHLARIDQLEQLCRDLHRGLVYALICAEVPLEDNGTYQDMKQRMADLGLIHETEYDPDTGLKWGEQA